MKDLYCMNCGSKIDGAMKFCIKCGAKIEDAPPALENPIPKAVQNAFDGIYMQKNEDTIITNTRSVASDIVIKRLSATQTAGTMVFQQGMGNAEDVFESLAPLKLIINTARGLIGKIKGALKDKKRLISIIVVTLIWGLLMLMPMLGVDSRVFKFLSFLTFAQGGTSGGFLGMLGGTVGKVVFSHFIFSLIMPLLSGKGKPFGGIKVGFKALFGSFKMKSVEDISPMLLGAGLSLITYTFMNSSLTMQNSMIGIVAAFLSVKALSNKSGFLQNFMRSIIIKSSKRKTPDFLALNRVIAGITTGFVLCIPLTVIKIPFITPLVGLAMIITSAILLVVYRSRVEVVK